MPARLNLAGGTAEQILDAAEHRVQVLGFKGFSYADIANELGVSTASIHYHFPSKTDLGASLIARYTERLLDMLARIEVGPAEDVLLAYLRLFEEVLASGRLCLGCMLAAEFETLPAPMRELVAVFFAKDVAWLADLLRRGRDEGAFDYQGTPEAIAGVILGALHGAMVMARVSGGVERFRACGDVVMENLRPR